MSKFSSKNALSGLSRARILKKLMSYLKSEPLNLSNQQILKMKTKKLQYGNKNALFADCWARNKKKLFYLK